VKDFRHRILAFGLLLSFCFAIVPAETFHQHDFESEICKDDELHYADHAVDCELAKFILPAFEKPLYFRTSTSKYYFKALLIGESPLLSTEFLFSKRGRAPPPKA